MHRYEKAVELVRDRINSGVLRVGDRMPSVRQFARETGYSILTIYHAYELLETQGICQARDRSGFYVTSVAAPPAEFPRTIDVAAPTPRSVGSLPETLLLSWEKRRLDAFGALQPSKDLYARENLDKALGRVLRRGSGRIATYDLPEGDPVLRQAIARRAAQRGVTAKPSDIIVTRSGMDGFNLCLDTFAEPGATVLVESPSYFPMLASLKRRNLLAVELYSHPRTGVDPDQVRHLLATTDARICVLMATNHFPTGVTYALDKMERIVAAARDAGALIVENDMLGELAYDQARVMSLKAFDTASTVVQLGSFANFLSPAYSTGWVVAGPHAQNLLANQHFSGLQGGDGALQRAVGEYLESHSQERSLRRIRQVLSSRMRHGIDLIRRHFPPDCSVSQPDGGYMCWVRGSQRFDASSGSLKAVENQYSFLPGSLFSIVGSFSNFLALNFSFEWTPDLEAKMEHLGAQLRIPKR